MNIRSDADDFFVVGGTMKKDARSYVARPADEELFNMTLKGDYSNVLTARQMGKSSLMIRTAERLRSRGVRTVIIDLTAIGSEATASEWYFGLVTRLAQQLQLQTDEIKWWRARSDQGVVQRFSDFLRDVVLDEVSEPIAVFIDEIDTTLRLDFTDDFFAAIRALYNARASDATFQRLTFVLLGVVRPADLIQDRTRTPYNIGFPVDLRDFTLEEAGEVFLPTLDSVYPQRAEEILRWVLEWTGGQPYLTQKLCAAVVEQHNGAFTKTSVDQLVERLFLSEEARKESNLRAIRDRVFNSPHIVEMLKAYQQLLRDKPVADDERSIELNELKLTGLVHATPGGRLEVRNRVYTRVFDQQWTKDNLPFERPRWVVPGVFSIAVIVIFILGALLLSQQSEAESQAETFVESFQVSNSSEVRLSSLAGLIELGDQFVEQARGLFFDLTIADKLTLFDLASPDDVGSELLIVADEVYQDIGIASDDNELLTLISEMLSQVNGDDAENLVAEIEDWLQGREAAADGRYEIAVSWYDRALVDSEERGHENAGVYLDRAKLHIELSEHDNAQADFDAVLRLKPGLEGFIAGVYFDRATDSIELMEYDSALKSFDAALRLNPDLDLEGQIVKQMLGTPALAAQWEEQAILLPELSLIMPTLTPTATPTQTPIPPPTDTLLPNVTPEPSPTETSTQTPSPSPTIAFSPTPIVPLITGAFKSARGGSHVMIIVVEYNGLDADTDYRVVAYDPDYCPKPQVCRSWFRYSIKTLATNIIESGSIRNTIRLEIFLDNVFCTVVDELASMTEQLVIELQVVETGQTIDVVRAPIEHSWCG